MINNLPKGWIIKKLGGKDGIATIVTGNTPSRSNVENYGGSIPWIKPEDLDLEMYIDKSTEYLSDIGAKYARLIPPNSIMVSCIGNIGKIGISKRQVATNQQINSLVLKNGYDAKYVFYAVKYRMSNLKGINASLLSILNATDFGKLEISLPEKEGEQKRIAEIIDNKIITIKSIREAAQEQLEATESLPISILREMFNYK